VLTSRLRRCEIEYLLAGNLRRCPVLPALTRRMMEIRIGVLSSGGLLLNGELAGFSAIEAALQGANSQTDRVLYYRESVQGAPPPKVKDILDLVIARKLPISLSSKPDYSDYMDQFGQSHPRPAVEALPSSDPLAPHMPDVDLRPKTENVFAEARSVASRKSGGGIAIVRPNRRVMVLPRLPESPDNAQLARGMAALIPAGRPRNIAVIANTGCSIFQGATPPGLRDANQAIPFLGMLIGFSSIGHSVWAFEGHLSAFRIGVAESEFLLIDSGMLPFLEPDWMPVALGSMRPGGKVLLHDRAKYALVPLAPSNRPPGWRIAEPDGEASYANCLLTTLAKGNAKSVVLVPSQPVPDLASLADSEEELDWIAALPFQYAALNAGKVIAVLESASAKAKADMSQKEWLLPAKLVTGGEVRMQTFVFRRERKWLKTALHISKL
jgi:hypothetical protein